MGGEWKGVFLSVRLGVWRSVVSFPRPQTHFVDFLFAKNDSVSNYFHHFCAIEVVNCSRNKIIPEKNTFIPVLPRISGHSSRCPCGVGSCDSAA